MNKQIIFSIETLKQIPSLDFITTYGDYGF